MSETKKLLAKTAGAVALATLMGVSAFADSRPPQETNRDQNQPGETRRDDDTRNHDWQSSDQRGDNQRSDSQYGDERSGSRRNISEEGRIQRIDREGDGYRVQLERGEHSFFVPDMEIRSAPRGSSRVRDLRVGVTIRLGGLLDPRGYINVTSADWIGDGAYNRGRNEGSYGNDNRYLRGTVERVDYRRNAVLVREERSGRVVRVEVRSRSRRGIDLGNLERGDRVTFSGDFAGGNVFEAYRIESSRNGRRY